MVFEFPPEASGGKGGKRGKEREGRRGRGREGGEKEGGKARREHVRVTLCRAASLSPPSPPSRLPRHSLFFAGKREQREFAIAVRHDRGPLLPPPLRQRLAPPCPLRQYGTRRTARA
eukprot:1073810-Rhodomonas_salina.1